MELHHWATTSRPVIRSVQAPAGVGWAPRPTIGVLAGRATLCDMRQVTHREMRNQSGEILRLVAEGETIQVTNRGQLAALIVPPPSDVLTELAARGQVRRARRPPSALAGIVRRKPRTTSEAILADVRGCR
jgi:antitoxin (DNA-binding transcriptional repressor) of toxin-antitoxin stability system